MFSEKVRLILGFKGLVWESVLIEPVMPRPRLMPLTGGYRRTPTLQIGADVFCDTRVICEWLERLYPEPLLYPPGSDFTSRGVAEWADTHLFQVCVAVSFQPRALEAALSNFTAEQVEAFQRDRAQLAEGATGLPQFSPLTAEAHLHHHLARLDAELCRGDFLFGKAPTIADFSVYQCLWLIEGNAVMRTLLKDYAGVLGWMQRMGEIGHGQRTEIDPEDAIGYAREHAPRHLDDEPKLLPEEIRLGDRVAVTPADYGRIPVHGKLAACNEFEYVVCREDPEVGEVAVHFPRVGFTIERH